MSTPTGNIVVHMPHWLVGGVERVLSLLMPEWAKGGRKVYLATPKIYQPGLPVPHGIERLDIGGGFRSRKRFWDTVLVEKNAQTVIFNSYEDIADDVEYLKKKTSPV